jgi:hypothetical protein
MSNVVYKQYGGIEMSEITDTMMNIAEELKLSIDWPLEKKYELQCRAAQVMAEAHRGALSIANEYIDAFKTQKEEFHKLADAYKELQKEYDQTPELVFLSFSLDPAGTLQDFLKHMERQAKIEDQSGDAWKWKFKLTLKNRLKIALKLIFRPKIKEEVI